MVDGLWAGDSSLTKDYSTQIYRMQLLGFNAVRLPFSFKDFSLPGRTDYNWCRAASIEEIKTSVTPPGEAALSQWWHAFLLPRACTATPLQHLFRRCQCSQCHVSTGVRPAHPHAGANTAGHSFPAPRVPLTVGGGRCNIGMPTNVFDRFLWAINLAAKAGMVVSFWGGAVSPPFCQQPAFTWALHCMLPLGPRCTCRALLGLTTSIVGR